MPSPPWSTGVGRQKSASRRLESANLFPRCPFLDNFRVAERRRSWLLGSQPHSTIMHRNGVLRDTDGENETSIWRHSWWRLPWPWKTRNSMDQDECVALVFLQQAQKLALLCLGKSISVCHCVYLLPCDASLAINSTTLGRVAAVCVVVLCCRYASP